MSDLEQPRPLPAEYYNTPRPATVIVAMIIVGVQALLAINIGLRFFLILGLVTDATVVPASTRWAVGIALAVGIIEAVVVFSIALRQGAARFVLFAVGAALVVADIVAGTLSIGDGLWAVAMILLFLPPSNAWFRSRPPAVSV